VEQLCASRRERRPAQCANDGARSQRRKLPHRPRRMLIAA
jgi:hypothetical protein